MKLCKKYNRAFCPILNLIPYASNDTINNNSADSTGQPNNSNKKDSNSKRVIDSEEVVNIRTPQSKILEWQPPKPEQEKAFNKILKN
jgi:hypothetical protein